MNWYNFLLACPNCNSIKGDGWLNVNEYYWPDVHNTHLLYEFYPLGIVMVKPDLQTNIDRARAQKTFELTGIGRYNTSDGDRRWIKRSEAWGKATVALTFYEKYGKPHEFILIITNNATSSGFWSVWMKVFENHIEVQNALIVAFNHTYPNCLTTDIDRL